MTILKPTNLVLRFLLELCALAALGYWGFTTPDSTAAKVLLGLGAPLAAAVLWGIFVSPKARVKLPDYGRLVLEIVVFGSAVLALFDAGQPGLGWIFAVLASIHLPLTFMFRQRGM